MLTVPMCKLAMDLHWGNVPGFHSIIRCVPEAYNQDTQGKLTMDEIKRERAEILAQESEETQAAAQTDVEKEEQQAKAKGKGKDDEVYEDGEEDEDGEAADGEESLRHA